MNEVTYEAPTGENREPIMWEVMEYWKQRMRVSGASIGFSEGCSTAFSDPPPVDADTPEDPVDPKYSDYEEHRLQMDATPTQLRELLAMLRARGIKTGGV